jgi:membrane-bound lytic murein transglycosylase D
MRRVPPPSTPAPRPGTLTPPAPLGSTSPPAIRGPKGAPPKTMAWLAQLKLPDLPVRWEPKLLSYLRFYRNHRRGRAIMRTWLRRMGRYRPLIDAELRRQKLPRALVYVAMIESGFNPRRTSRVGAAGLWQFMPRTGRGYGMKRDYWLDQRRDPQRSTVAALRYLGGLYRRFRSWDLTLAAYNAGFGTVLKAVQKYNTNDYWKLARYEAGLPWSTSLYVPKIVAAAIVGENRKAFGYASIKPDRPIAAEMVKAPRSLTLAQVARATGATVSKLRLLNPELRRGRTPPRIDYWVRVPKGKAQTFYGNLARLGALRYRPYRLKLGEDDRSVATRFGISRRTLRRINGVSNGAELRPGLLILVPARAPRAGARPSKRRRAQKNNTQEPLLVALPKGSPSKLPGRRRVFYRIVLGDTLPVIARHLGVTVAEIARWNALDIKAKLISQMVLQAFVPAKRKLGHVKLLDPRRVRVHVAGSSRFLAEHERRKGRRRVTYRVRQGDTLTRVARRFRLSVGSLMRINRFGRRTKLRKGETIIVYQARSREAKLRARGALRTQRRRTRAAKRERRRLRRKPRRRKRPARLKAAKRPRRLKAAKRARKRTGKRTSKRTRRATKPTKRHRERATRASQRRRKRRSKPTGQSRRRRAPAPSPAKASRRRAR